MRRWVLAAALVCVPMSAQAMTVAEFMGKATALKKKGPLALMSPDIKLLKAEMVGITTAYRADAIAARSAGKPLSCPPTGRVKMGAGELMASLATIPAEQARVMPMKTAFYAFMKRRYPCPA